MPPYMFARAFNLNHSNREAITTYSLIRPTLPRLLPAQDCLAAWRQAFPRRHEVHSSLTDERSRIDFRGRAPVAFPGPAADGAVRREQGTLERCVVNRPAAATAGTDEPGDTRSATPSI